MADAEFQGLEPCDIENTSLEVDPTITELIRTGMPAVSSGCRHERQVIKQGRLFLVSDADGEVSGGCKCGMGLYHEDTRFISRLAMRLQGEPATLLSGSSERTNMAMIKFMNPPLDLEEGASLHQESLHISVTRALNEVLREQIRLVNFNPFEVTLRLSLAFFADFADIFEVRGLHRQDHGTFFRPLVSPSGIVLAYRGGDDLLRQARIRFFQAPDEVQIEPCAHASIGASALWIVRVAPNGGQAIIEYQIAAVEGTAALRSPVPFPEFIREAEALGRVPAHFPTAVRSDHEVFNLVLDRSIRDLVALVSTYPTGPFLAAGIPWFTSPFGRDALITAYQSLMLGPEMAKGALRFLAKHQGRHDTPFKDEQPGKILHEFRFGELARLGLIPHTPYYGTVDATPLWIILLSETYRWTGDTQLVHELWGNLEAALLWLETYGDLDDDGFTEYLCRSPKGIRNQGWKDSFNSVIFPDGTLAEAPIALCEVQGYVYDAKRRASELCRVVGQELLAKRLLNEAEALKEAFNSRFWNEREGYCHLAFDGQKRPVPTLTSNPGHCLWSGIVSSDRREQLVQTLLGPGMFSGWGIRTLSADSPVYNPIGYHNGTVWPHDNALIAKGMADCGFKKEANQVFDAMFDCAVRFPYYRLPELFCGFERQGELDSPVPYPVACSPQAWAAATPILLLQAALGLQADAPRRTLKILSPTLPHWLGRVTLRGVTVGKASIDLEFIQTEGTTTTRILEKRGDLRLLIEG